MSEQVAVSSRQGDTAAEQRAAARARKAKADQTHIASIVLGSMMSIGILAGVYALVKMVMYYYR